MTLQQKSQLQAKIQTIVADLNQPNPNIKIIAVQAQELSDDIDNIEVSLDHEVERTP